MPARRDSYTQGRGMVLDLSHEMAELAASLGSLASPASPERGRVIQFAAARAQEGVSTVAREFARFMASRMRRPVWLVDADLDGQGQYAYLIRHQTRFGAVGAATAASPDGSIFYRISPQALENGQSVPDVRYLSAHPVGGVKLWVTRFRSDRLNNVQTAQVFANPGYWNALRKHADLVVIDTPAAERSQAAINLAPFVDATVLVAAADETEIQSPAILRSALQGAGGRVAGLFFNKVDILPPPFLKSVMP